MGLKQCDESTLGKELFTRYSALVKDMEEKRDNAKVSNEKLMLMKENLEQQGTQARKRRIERMEKVLKSEKLPSYFEIEPFFSAGGKKLKKRRVELTADFCKLEKNVAALFGSENDVSISTLNDCVIGSNVELVSHLEELVNDTQPVSTVAPLKVEICQSKVSCDTDLLSSLPSPLTSKKKSGLWTSSEIMLFSNGVLKFGWGKWTSIASYVQTRDAKQVKHFSETNQGREFKIVPTKIDGFIALANSVGAIAEGLSQSNSMDSALFNRLPESE